MNTTHTHTAGRKSNNGLTVLTTQGKSNGEAANINIIGTNKKGRCGGAPGASAPEELMILKTSAVDGF